jgi:hypothetical protein
MPFLHQRKTWLALTACRRTTRRGSASRLRAGYARRSVDTKIGTPMLMESNTGEKLGLRDASSFFGLVFRPSDIRAPDFALRQRSPLQHDESHETRDLRFIALSVGQ